MRKSIKVAAEIRINNFSMASVDQLMNVSYCVQCAAVSPIGECSGVDLPRDRFENQNHRHSAAGSRIAGTPSGRCFHRLRYVITAAREEVDKFGFSALAPVSEPSFSSVRLDVFERSAVFSCRSTVGFAAVVGDARTSFRYTLSYSG